MRGIELAEEWFENYGKPLLENEFPELMPELAAGLAGHGSECYGFDDEISRDHDFSAGVSLWLPEEVEAKHGFALSRRWEKLVREHPFAFHAPESRGGAPEQGIDTIEAFLLRHLGISTVPQEWRQWLYLPENSFAEAVNGKLFFDGSGKFTAIRETLRSGIPEDVRKKKLAARAVQMAQSGQYNFSRCLKHGERGAAHYALSEFVRASVSMVFLLNQRFPPYYKWMFRAMRQLPVLGELAEALEFLLADEAPEKVRSEVIEDLCSKVAGELRTQGLSDSPENYLEAHGFEIMSRIENREIRALHVLEG